MCHGFPRSYEMHNRLNVTRTPMATLSRPILPKKNKEISVQSDTWIYLAIQANNGP